MFTILCIILFKISHNFSALCSEFYVLFSLLFPRSLSNNPVIPEMILTFTAKYEYSSIVGSVWATLLLISYITSLRACPGKNYYDSAAEILVQ